MQRFLFILAIVFASISSANAQIEVSLDIKRRVFLRGEPIEAIVTVRNLAGRDITLSDEGADKWFSFEIFREDSPIPPHAANYRNSPLTVASGEAVSRVVDIAKLYPVNELSTYKVRASVRYNANGKEYVSRRVMLDVSEGRKVYSQTVGVPPGLGGSPSELRLMSLISFQLPKEQSFYARVEDESTGAIFATYPLGRIILDYAPMVEFDGQNTMYAFHMVGPGQYALSRIGVNGEWLGQTLWRSARGRAAVRKKPDGRMVVVGATRERAAAPNAPPVPKLSAGPPVLLPGQ